MHGEEKYLGYLKYSGKLVEEGLMDARKAGLALVGFDEALRYFIEDQYPELKKIDFEIPVKIEKGSWQALIPEDVGGWIITALGSGVTAYTVTAAAQMAKNDFDKIGIKNAFKGSLKTMIWLARIGIHVGDLTVKKFFNIKFKNNNTEIGIPNKENKYLYIPKKNLDAISKCPPKLLNKVSSLIENDRQLIIGVKDSDGFDEVNITRREKNIFFTEFDDDVLFPELKHGQYIELEGGITRGNEKTNTLGFEHKKHILTCKPEKGNIASYKNKIIAKDDDLFFPEVRIFGIIDRRDRFGEYKEKRPMIIFNKIIPIENGSNKQKLF